jgi:hypothetical protein
MKPTDRSRWACYVVLIVALLIGCRHNVAQNNPATPKRDINAVLRDHDKELLAIPDVAGVYVGLAEDGRTQCLKVMLVRKTRETDRSIPREIEGYRVITEVTGEIRPLGKP